MYFLFSRLLKVLNLSERDIDNLQDLWQGKVAIDESDDSINSISDESSSDGRVHLSSNSVYLKKALSKPLIQGLREIVMKKPADPVEYLAHWLLHFKVRKFYRTYFLITTLLYNFIAIRVTRYGIM